MEPIYCPNGHPNRPGTRICIICRELIAPSSPPAPHLPPKPDNPPSQPDALSLDHPANTTVETAAKPAPADATSSGKSRRLWPWLLLLLLVVVAGAVLLYSLLYPARRTTTISPTQPAQTAPAVAVDTATSEPTATSQPTVSPSSTPAEATPTIPGSPTTVATITPLPTIVGVIITPTLAFGPEVNFIQNGSFVDDWVNGWTLESRGEAAEIVIGPATDGPETQSLKLARSGPGMSRLAQRVVLTFPVEGLIFRGRLRLAGTASNDGEGRAAVILRYEDANGDPVGSTVWMDGSADDSDLWGIIPLPVSGPTVSERYVREGWQNLELSLAQEFADELAGVDMESVRQITVIMAVVGGESCPPSGCETLLEVAELSITAEGP